VAVALHQLWLVTRFDLSAWCGGGFGMFSTTDGWGTRHLHAYALGPAFRTGLEPPPALEHDVEQALALPTEGRLRRLALALAAHAPHDLEAPDTVRIEVFARRYDPETLAPSGVLLRSLDAPLASAATPP
jgi:hypothetical protein